MPEPVDLDFLGEMKLQATLQAESLHSKDHWAKPFYSDVNLFKPNVRRVFIGVNSKGDRYSRKYDKKQKNEQRVWSETSRYITPIWTNVGEIVTRVLDLKVILTCKSLFKGFSRLCIDRSGSPS